MINKKFLAVKIVGFFIGIGLLFFATRCFYLLQENRGTDLCVFLQSTIGIMYTVLYIAIFGVGVFLKKSDRFAPLFFVSWKFIVPFEIISCILLVFVIFGYISAVVGWVLLIIITILISVTLFLICLRHRQKNAAGSERPGLGLITQIRSSMDNLVLKTAALPEKNDIEKNKIEVLDEDVNAMDAVNTIDAAKLEQEILMNVTQISSLCDSVIAGSDDNDFKKLLSVIENQVRERKLRNNS